MSAHSVDKALVRADLEQARSQVTICIAAGCRHGHEFRLILCTDRRISSAIGSAEIMLKQRVIGRKFMCLTAGTDNEIQAVLRLLRTETVKYEALDDMNVLKMVRDSLNTRKRQKAEEFTQGQFALSYDEFFNIGKTKLPDEIYREAWTQIRLIKVDARFIIAGFYYGHPLLVDTTEECQARIREDYSVIGSGEYLAGAGLLSRGYSDVLSLPQALYAVFEAKKGAESIGTVGKSTSISIISPDGKSQHVSAKGHQVLESLYASVKPRPIPSEIDVTPDMLDAAFELV